MTNTKRIDRKKERKAIRQEAARALKTIEPRDSRTVVVLESSSSVYVEGQMPTILDKEIAEVVIMERERTELRIDRALLEDRELDKLSAPLKQMVEDTAHLRPTPVDLRERIIRDPTISAHDLTAVFEKGRSFWKERM